MLLRGKPNGFVRDIYNNMDYFEGFLYDNKIEGFGKFFFHDGSVTEGYWKDGKSYNSKTSFNLV